MAAPISGPVGKYRIDSILGEGAMGVVYKDMAQILIVLLP